ncbi:putative ABC transport system permease protein [Bradyrhizobium algeriense]|uniref:ABC transport system permease protein n=2 Tax=Bradyrhizobium algeriense TaxID=634784 RepID=A0ABU8BNJ4_9BRAD
MPTAAAPSSRATERRKAMVLVAIKMLTGDRGKYLGMVLGLVFTTFIMTQQPAMFFGLVKRSYGFVSDAALADIWVMDPMVRYIDDIKPLSDTTVARVRGVEGVGWAVPIYKGTTRVRLADGNFQNSVLIGLDDTTLIGGPPIILSGKLADLRRADGVIVSADGANNRFARPSPRSSEPPIPLMIGDVIEMNERRAVVVGISEATTTNMGVPTIYTTYSRAKSYVPSERKTLSFVLVKAKAGTEVGLVISNIRHWTGLAAVTREQFEQMTLWYVIQNTPAFTLFGLSAIIGFGVGGLIAGQTFYNFTLENLRYFGVMKAMGATNRTLLTMIMAQALVAGAIGYGLGVGLISLFSLVIGPRFPFELSWSLFLVSACGIVLLCVIASGLSMRKVIRLDPASVFKT